MPHLNKLQAKYGEKGLTVIGVASESESKTDPWIKANGVEYAYAFDHKKALFRAVGATGFPSAVLIDPQGNIAYLGHPARIDNSMIEGVLDGALTTPVYEWPKELDKVAKAVRKGDLAGAMKKIERVSDDFPEIATAIQGMVIGRVKSLEKAVADGDWLLVETLGSDLSKTLGKMPEGETVDQILTSLKKNKDAQSILKAQKKVAKLIDGGVKKAKRDNVKKALKKIRNAYPDTAAERDARAALDGLRGTKRG